jgi:dihydroorotase
MANTKPACSSMETVNYVINKAKEIGLVDVHQTVSITENLEGQSIEHLDKITEPVRLISDDGYGVVSNDVMLRAMRKAVEKNLTVISHAEDKNISAYDMRDSENVGTLRDLALARYTGARLHMAHVSTVESMQEVIAAKKAGFNITCEVTPHHIALSSDITYRVNPPLREVRDIACLMDAIKLGYVDAIGTDHAPHTPLDKQNGAPGISGIETAFCVCYTTLVKENEIDIKTLSKIMSCNPAQIMGVNKGKIEKGYEGDLVLVDLNKKVKVESEKFQSKGKNTPFNGMEFYGDIAATIKAGKIVYEGDGYKL